LAIYGVLAKVKLNILLNGFKKKSQKTPQNEIRLAEKLMKEYLDEQKQLKKS